MQLIKRGQWGVISIDVETEENTIAGSLARAFASNQPDSADAVLKIHNCAVRAIAKVSNEFRMDMRGWAETNAFGWPKKHPMTILRYGNPPQKIVSKRDNARRILKSVMVKSVTQLGGKMFPAIRFKMNDAELYSMVGFFGRDEFGKDAASAMASSRSLTSWKIGWIARRFQLGGDFQGRSANLGGPISEPTRKYMAALGIHARRGHVLRRPERDLVSPAIDKSDLPGRVQAAFLARINKVQS